MLSPRPPPYDIAEWRAAPFPARLRMVCEAWALQGYGTPPLINLVYLVKIAVLYVGGWWWFCSLSPGLGGWSDVGTWALSPTAFQKAVLWTMAYEGLGLGCGSGPLTGRYVPPIGGVLYFVRPGTLKQPLLRGVPLVGGDQRTWLDVGLYVAHYGLLFRALSAPEISPALLWPTAVLLPVLGLFDKTVFLASRAEHHYTALVCFLFPGAWLAGCKVVWLAIWWWAATSKLNRHFPSVVCVMLSNSPLVPQALRKKLYRRFPSDLRPGAAAIAMAHGGTAVEYVFPALLLVGEGGPLSRAALAVMFGFHLFITANVPMGVPIEWNVVMVYGGFFLFGEQAAIGLGALGGAPVLVVLLVVALGVVPLVGNLVPSRVSFLPAMRYYAGNWAYSVWLFRDGCSRKLDLLVKSSPHVRDQLALLYDTDTIDAVLSKVMAFRAMHLHGRALATLVPRAVDDVGRYEWLDGEIVAGLALGWNFGDGHLHDGRLLAAVQPRCGFEVGELVCIFVESQPLGRATLSYTVADAARGVIERGEIDVRALEKLQPWPV